MVRRKITRKMIEDGFRVGIIQLVKDPNSVSGTVCKIGDNWFYFGGETAEELSPDDYMENVPLDDIIDEVLVTLDDFYDCGECFEDEYEYYRLMLTEAVVA